MIGISSPSFSLCPLSKVAEEVAEHFKLWEIVAEAKHSLSENKRELADLLSSYDLEIQVHAPISDVNLGSLIPEMRSVSFQILWSTLDACHDLGAKTVTIHPGYLSPIGFYAPHKVKEACKKSLMDLDKVNRGYGLDICLENMPSMPIMTGFSAEDIEYYLDGIDMLFCLDVGHANTVGGLSSFENLLPSLGNVHVHDNSGERDEHLDVGDGSVDWPEVKRVLEKYNGNIIIETRTIEGGLRSLENVKKMLL